MWEAIHAVMMESYASSLENDTEIRRRREREEAERQRVARRNELRKLYLDTLTGIEKYNQVVAWDKEDVEEFERKAEEERKHEDAMRRMREQHARDLEIRNMERLQAAEEVRIAMEQQRIDDAIAAERKRQEDVIAAEKKAWDELPYAKKLQHMADLRLKDILGPLHDWVMKK